MREKERDTDRHRQTDRQQSKSQIARRSGVEREREMAKGEREGGRATPHPCGGGGVSPVKRHHFRVWRQ